MATIQCRRDRQPPHYALSIAQFGVQTRGLAKFLDRVRASQYKLRGFKCKYVCDGHLYSQCTIKYRTYVHHVQLNN